MIRIEPTTAARMLIINADDFGMCQSVNTAILESMLRGVVRSTTLMPVCPGTDHAIELLRKHPQLAFGVHLTVVCDTLAPRYGPLTAAHEVPTLVDETGAFYTFERMPELLAGLKLEELETEWRAQIARVLAAGLAPTHLDWHCLRFADRPEIGDLMLRLARSYGLALRVRGAAQIASVQALGLPTSDHDFLDSFSLDLAEKPAQYARLLRALPPGLSEWAVHPGRDSAELRAMHPASVGVRQSDLEALLDPALAAEIAVEKIVLLDYRPLQAVWRSTPQTGGSSDCNVLR